MFVCVILLTAFVFNVNKHSTKAPKLGMDVNIVDRGFVKHDKDEGDLVNIFKRDWKLVTWFADDDGVWQAIVYDKAYSWSLGNVPTLYILVKVPVAALKYKYHHTGFGRVSYVLKSPQSMKHALTPKHNDASKKIVASQEAATISVEIEDKQHTKNKDKIGVSKSGNGKNKKKE